MPWHRSPGAQPCSEAIVDLRLSNKHVSCCRACNDNVIAPCIRLLLRIFTTPRHEAPLYDHSTANPPTAACTSHTSQRPTCAVQAASRPASGCAPQQQKASSAVYVPRAWLASASRGWSPVWLCSSGRATQLPVFAASSARPREMWTTVWTTARAGCPTPGRERAARPSLRARISSRMRSRP